MNLIVSDSLITINGQPYQKGWLQVWYHKDNLNITIKTYPALHPVWEGAVTSITGNTFPDIGAFKTFEQTNFY
jgi:hypothetical protein